MRGRHRRRVANVRGGNYGRVATLLDRDVGQVLDVGPRCRKGFFDPGPSLDVCLVECGSGTFDRLLAAGSQRLEPGTAAAPGPAAQEQDYEPGGRHGTNDQVDGGPASPGCRRCGSALRAPRVVRSPPVPGQAWSPRVCA